MRCSWSPPAVLADCVGQDRLDAGAIYPDQKELRNVAAHVATAVIGEVQRQQGRAARWPEVRSSRRPRGDVVPGIPKYA